MAHSKVDGGQAFLVAVNRIHGASGLAKPEEARVLGFYRNHERELLKMERDEFLKLYGTEVMGVRSDWYK